MFIILLISLLFMERIVGLEYTEEGEKDQEKIGDEEGERRTKGGKRGRGKGCRETKKKDKEKKERKNSDIT